MRISFVTPAWGRFAVTRLALAQRAQLVSQLALRGVTADCVVIADDENIDIACSFGFDAIEMDNEFLGRKVNSGFEWAGERGSDYVAFIGSDDWMHVDLFDPLDGERVIAGHEISVCDLITGRMRHLGWRSKRGVPPWLIPRAALERCSFRPCRDSAKRGMEFQIEWGLRDSDAEWVFHDPHPLTRVDFKSDIGMTNYDTISRAIGRGSEITPPWGALAEKFSPDLVEMARETHELYAEAIAA
jgi:hypothetical protein